MGIADEIITSMNKSISNEYDDVGLPIPQEETNDYIVARIICRNKDRLFKIGDTIFRDRKPLDGNIRQTIVVLNGKEDKLIRGDNCLIIWERLKEVLPEYDRDAIEIVNGIVWNRKNADIEYRNETEGGNI